MTRTNNLRKSQRLPAETQTKVAGNDVEVTPAMRRALNIPGDDAEVTPAMQRILNKLFGPNGQKFKVGPK